MLVPICGTRRTGNVPAPVVPVTRSPVTKNPPWSRTAAAPFSDVTPAGGFVSVRLSVGNVVVHAPNESAACETGTSASTETASGFAEKVPAMATAS